MDRRRAVCLLASILGLTGCGRRPSSVPPPPLTLEQWQALPVDKKYTAESLERLREGDPKHRDEAEWTYFLRAVVKPQQMKDRIRK